MKTLLLAGLCLCFSFSVVYGQTTDLMGNSALTVMVTEARNGEPVEMATVYIIPVGDTIVKAFTFSDRKGQAHLKDFAAGRYIVNVQLLGFKPYSEEHEFPPHTFRTISVALKENIEELKGAGITEMGDLVTVKGDTLIYNATSIRTGNNASLGDLLKKFPGVEVERGRVKVNGETIKRITVEGRTFFFDNQARALENLPAVIVNQIRVIDKENNGRFGLSGRERHMDIKLKEEFREAWFGRASAEGGVSVKDKDSDRFGDGTKGLYNAKIYAQYYGDKDNITVLGGGNNVNSNQLTVGASGMSDIASVGANYNTSRVKGMDTDVAASYDFRQDDNRSESHRTSFLSSGEKLETNRSQSGSVINHSAEASFSIGTPQLQMSSSGGFDINGSFIYNHKKQTANTKSLTNNSLDEILNGSESYSSGCSDDFSANVRINGSYPLDVERRHRIEFKGNIGYDGRRGNSEESSVVKYGTALDERNLLYYDKDDCLDVNGYVNYSVRLPQNWNIYSEMSAFFSTSRENRDAENAVDYSRNDWYSICSKNKNLSLKQTVNASCRIDLSERKHFNVTFGLGVYEDLTSHFSKTFAAVDRSNDFWQVNAGPDISLSYRTKSFNCAFYTRGRSLVPPQGDAISTNLNVSNPVDISTGNIYLKAGYHQDANLSIRYGNASAKGGFVDLRLSGSVDVNELTRASWYDASAVRYSIPVNSRKPRYNTSLYLTYIQPLNKKKSLNLSVVPKLFFNTGTIYIADTSLPGFDLEEFDYAAVMAWLYGDRDGSEFYSGRSGFRANRTQEFRWTLDVGLKYELKDWSFSAGASVNNSCISYSAYPGTKVNTWRYNAYAEALWKHKTGWEAECRFDYNGYQGYSAGYNNPDWLLELKLAKDIGSFTLSLSAYDILGSAKSFVHSVSAEFIEDTYRNNLGRCILLGISYNFGKWNLGKQARMESLQRKNSL